MTQSNLLRSCQTKPVSLPKRTMYFICFKKMDSILSKKSLEVHIGMKYQVLSLGKTRQKTL